MLAESQLIFSCRDILDYLPETFKICDIFRRITCLFQKRLVIDDAVVLDDICNTCHLVSIHQSKTVVGKFPCDV